MDQDFIFRNPPEGQAIQGEPSDIGKPIGFLQSGLLGVLLTGASFVGSPLQPAVTAAAVNDVLLVSPGTYAAEGTITIPKSISLQGIGVAGGSGFTIAAATVANGLIVAIQTALVIGAATLGTGGSFRAVNSVLGSIAGGGTVVLQGSTVVGTIAALQVTATDSTIVGAMTISGALATLTDCSFGPGVVVTFSGAPGVLQLNGTSYLKFFAEGGTVVNGTVTSDTFLARGILTLIGVTPVPVAVATITAENDVILTLSDPNGGTVGVAPRVIITPGVGFAVTAAALDTSKYFYRVI